MLIIAKMYFFKKIDDYKKNEEFYQNTRWAFGFGKN